MNFLDTDKSENWFPAYFSVMPADDLRFRTLPALTEANEELTVCLLQTAKYICCS